MLVDSRRPSLFSLFKLSFFGPGALVLVFFIHFSSSILLKFDNPQLSWHNAFSSVPTCLHRLRVDCGILFAGLSGVQLGSLD